MDHLSFKSENIHYMWNILLLINIIKFKIRTWQKSARNIFKFIKVFTLNFRQSRNTNKFSTNSKFIYSATLPSIHEAVSKVNIFANGYSSGSLIICPASYHDSICPRKANLVQDHGYFSLSLFLKDFRHFLH